MKLSEDFTQSRLQLKFYALFQAVIVLAYAFICTPVSAYLNSDILLAGTILPLLLDAVMLLLNYLFYWMSYAALLFLCLDKGFRACRTVLIVYAAAVFFRYPLNLIGGSLVLGFPTASVFLSQELPEMLFGMGMDLVLIAVALLPLRYLLRHLPQSGINVPDPAELTLPSCLPIGRWLEKGNIVLRTVLFLALIPAGIQLLLRLYYDIFFWGAIRGWLDLLWVILYYLSDLVFIPVGYLVMIVLINRLYLFLWKRKNTASATGGKEPA